jgi:excisionase family DNA binding protein
MMDVLLTETEVAEILHLSRRRVQDLCRAGQLAYVQVAPRQRAFLQEHVDAYVRSKTIIPPKKIDSQAGMKLPSPRKGGDAQKSPRDMERAQIRKELAQWR